MAFLGLKGTMPLFHGSQGCTAFAKVVLVRHFREAIPLLFPTNFEKVVKFLAMIFNTFLLKLVVKMAKHRYCITKHHQEVIIDNRE